MEQQATSLRPLDYKLFSCLVSNCVGRPVTAHGSPWLLQQSPPFQSWMLTSPWSGNHRPALVPVLHPPVTSLPDHKAQSKKCHYAHWTDVRVLATHVGVCNDEESTLPCNSSTGTNPNTEHHKTLLHPETRSSPRMNFSLSKEDLQDRRFHIH